MDKVRYTAALIAGVSASCLLWISPATATTITHFSHSLSFVQAGSTGSSTDPEYFAKDFNAAGALTNTERNFDVPEGTASTSASASLSGGELKAGAEAIASGDGGAFSSFSRADFGDSFQAFSGFTPHSWQAEDQGTFTVNLSGLNQSSMESQVWSEAFLYLSLFTPGTLDAYGRWLGGDNLAFDEWQAGHLETFGYALGDLSPTDFGETLVSEFPTTIDIPFNPGGDFDWAVSLITYASINGSFASSTAFAVVDFTQTAVLGYTGPAGTQTISASGMFPGTLITPIPLPAALPLFVAALAFLGFLGRRRRLACSVGG